MGPLEPVLVRAGPLELRWSGVLLALGLVAGYLVAQRTAARWGLTGGIVRDVALWSLPEALLGARIAYVLAHPEIYLLAPARVIQIWDGGLAFGAALVVGIVAAWRHACARHLPAGRLADAAVPGLLVGQALAALGRALDALAWRDARLPPWHHPTPLAAAEGLSWAGVPFSTAVAAPLLTAAWAVVLLAGYRVLVDRPTRPGLLFVAYLGTEALAQVALGLWLGPGGPSAVIGAGAWVVVALTAAAVALYHQRVPGSA